jgi:choline dehydrogenase-like flavoprotein
LQRRVNRLRHETDGRWSIETVDTHGNTETQGAYNACVLASSAIGNVEILGRTLGRRVVAQITDHFAIGVVARLPPSEPLETFRHSKLWTGYLPAPELSANIFVQEQTPLENGDRMVELFALVEQGSKPEDYSTLTVEPHEGATSTSFIETRISSGDNVRLAEARRALFGLAERIAEQDLEDVTIADRHRDNIVVEVDDSRRTAGYADRDRIGQDPRMVSYDIAVHALVEQTAAGKIAEYHLPYGAVEHEACTHPIGGNSIVSVSDQLEVEELRGVYVAGPGSIVRPGAANTALTILALSQHLTETLAEVYGQARSEQRT